jgi:two-component system response regulator
MAATNNRWLLVVEDNPDDELLARRAFTATERPETLRVATNGEEALEVLRDNDSPVLVLLDLKLPRLSGVEVIMEMKDDPRLRTIPIVVLTFSDEITDIGACYDLGCNAFVRKPIDYEEFLSVLGATLKFWLNVNITLGQKKSLAAT